MKSAANDGVTVRRTQGFPVDGGERKGLVEVS